VAAGISYNHKGVFTFYKDPQEPSEKLYKPRRPRKSSVETKEQHLEAISAWLEGGEHPLKVQASGNSMTQKFYTENILPQHLAHIEYLQQKYKHKILFQEDGDPSHGNRNPTSAPAQLKRASHTINLKHPAQSPDLNPIEAIWMIIKKRLRGGRWHTVAEFKAAIKREWHRITLTQIRRRISEMQARCKHMYNSNGDRYRSKLW
jgi:hypothetical protein